MQTKVEPIIFANRSGYNLFGTMHYPSESVDALPLIVLLSPGIKMRVGPHGLYNRITARLNDLGFTVFKFDFFGLGDSEGELNHDLLFQVYNDTESGRFVPDTEDALNWLEKTRGLSSFILGGLCGGAITGLLHAQNDPRVQGLISLGMTVTTSLSPDQRTKYASQAELNALRSGYIRKILNPKAWMRLLTLKSDFRTIIRSVGQTLSSKASVESDQTGSSVSESESTSNANPKFPPAFFSVADSGRKMLFVFSGADKAYWDYLEKFAEPHADRLSTIADILEIHVIADANHVLSFRNWESEMLDHVCGWLTANFRYA